MPEARLDSRFFATTRGRVLALLRRSSRTVDELAGLLDLTDNAVRSHLATLERDGLVRQAAERRTTGAVGKPAHVYQIAPDAERALSRAYPPVLVALMGALGERLGPAELEQLMRAVGRRLAVGRPPRSGTTRQRAAEAAGVLQSLGGDVEVEERDGKLVLRGHGCPLADVTRRHPEACRTVERLVAEVVGGRVRERCVRGERPACCFEVTLPRAG